MSARGMADEAGLLGEHDKMLVLVADVERYVVGGLEISVLSTARGNLDMDHITGDDDALLGRGLVVDEYASRLDEPHGRRARGELVDGQARDEGIETRALLVSAHLVVEDARHRPSPVLASAPDANSMRMSAMRKSTTPQVTHMSATLKTGKSMKVRRMKSTT